MRKPEYVYALNAGGVDPESIARVDLERMRLSGEHPVSNWLPKSVGPMTLRPGSEMLVDVPSDAQTVMKRFLRSSGSSTLLLFSDYTIRFMTDGTILQVPAVSTAIASGSWSNVSTSPATAVGGVTLNLTASQFTSAKLRQSVSVSGGDQGKVHVLRVVVASGPVYLRVGTSAGGQEYLSDIELATGTHKIGFTPFVGTIYVEIRSDARAVHTVSQIQFESTLLGGTGDFTLTTEYLYADCQALRTYQSIDVLFVGEGTKRPARIERRGAYSWSIVQLIPRHGPFTFGSSKVSMTPSAQTGNITLTASENYFKSTHVGALVELTHSSKVTNGTLAALSQATDYISVYGVTGGRNFQASLTFTGFTGTVTLERSLQPDNPSTWTAYKSYSGPATVTLVNENDGLDNVTAHYRWNITAFTAGSVYAELIYDGSYVVGEALITAYTGPTSVSAEVIEPFGIASATQQWRISSWSDSAGWPRTPVIHDGRMYWIKDDMAYGSVIDDYDNYDDSTDGDGGPVVRSIGAGGGQSVALWAISHRRLAIGMKDAEMIVQASELDEPITPTAFTARKASARGSANLDAVEHDDGLFFVDRSTKLVYDLGVSDGNRYVSQNISRLNPAATRTGISRIAVQKRPETRMYGVLRDGTAVVFTFDRDDKVAAWTTMTLAGSSALIEDIETIPGSEQDEVYLVVNRSGQRYIERLSQEATQITRGGCTLLDAHKVLTGTLTSITGATHLIGQTVQVWADNERRSDVLIDGSGNALLGATYSRVVYGLGYTAQFKSAKLAYAARLGVAIGQDKIIRNVGLVLRSSCVDGLTVGKDFDNLEPLPDIIDGAVRTNNQFFLNLDTGMFPVTSDWSPDSRICIQALSAEGPCTVQGIVLDIETHDGAP